MFRTIFRKVGGFFNITSVELTLKDDTDTAWTTWWSYCCPFILKFRLKLRTFKAISNSPTISATRSCFHIFYFCWQ